MKIVFHPSFFGDIFYRRVGWQKNFRISFFNHPGGYELWLWCFWLFMPHLTKHAPDVVDSVASVSISPASEVSASEADSTPATTQVM